MSDITKEEMRKEFLQKFDHRVTYTPCIEYSYIDVFIDGKLMNSWCYSDSHKDEFNDLKKLIIEGFILGRQSLPEKSENYWRDVSVDGLPKENGEVLMVRDNKTVWGAWLGDSFWCGGKRCAALYWMPLPSPVASDNDRCVNYEENDNFVCKDCGCNFNPVYEGNYICQMCAEHA